MECVRLLLFLSVIGGTLRLSRTTCVLESDFGFVLNCAFKKSGLFRVRNLGGVKAHIGLGFSVGDELGFKESISNVEMNRRRSVQGSRFQAAAAQALQAKVGNPIRSASDKSPGRPIQESSTIPPFKPIPPAPERPLINDTNIYRPQAALPAMAGIVIPSMGSKPSSISRLSDGPTLSIDTTSGKVAGLVVPVSKNKGNSEKLSSTNLALRTLPNTSNELAPPLSHADYNSIQMLLASNNLTEKVAEKILIQRQKLAQATTTTKATYKPASSADKITNSIGKVMNAPKEYYPVGYDKNFDDNFASRVELPETSFHCGDQKHFPGLYADEDLGCMVFHVCALTDDGLIMKSFLCPESTLFDQTILKCNWWFYVDCKNSKKLYDSNIPISKSYQLMKALTFFSSYKTDSSNTPKSPDEH